MSIRSAILALEANRRQELPENTWPDKNGGRYSLPTIRYPGEESFVVQYVIPNYLTVANGSSLFDIVSRTPFYVVRMKDSAALGELTCLVCKSKAPPSLQPANGMGIPWPQTAEQLTGRNRVN